MALRSAAALLVAASLAGTRAPRPSPGDSVKGTYRMHGMAHVAARPALDDDVEVHADAVLRRGAGPRDVRVRVGAEGQTCGLTSTVGDDGALAFTAGQPCTFDVRGPGVRGRIQARLRSAHGRAVGGELALDMVWDLSGALSLRDPGSVLLGKDVGVSGAWTSDVPLRGEAHVSAKGHRDASRAGQQ